MAADDPHFRLRVPAGLKAKIEQAAQDNQRSINAEILARLDETFGGGDGGVAEFIGREVARALALYERKMAKQRSKTDAS